MDTEQKLISLLFRFSRLKSTYNHDPSKYISVITRIICVVRSMNFEIEWQAPETELTSSSLTVDCFKSSQPPDPLRKLLSLFSQTVVCFRSMDLESVDPYPLRGLVSIFSETLYPVNYSDSMYWELEIEWEQEPKHDDIESLFDRLCSLELVPELISLISEIIPLADSLEPEQKLKTLIAQLIFVDDDPDDSKSDYSTKLIYLCIDIISLVSSVDWDSKPKPESELISLIMQSISFFDSMDLDFQPEPVRKLISLFSRRSSIINFSGWYSDLDREFLDLFLDEKSMLKLGSCNILYVYLEKLFSLVTETMSLEPEPELISLIHQILSLVLSMNSNWKKLISLCPQVQVISQKGKFHAVEQASWTRNDKWHFLDRDSTTTGGYVELKVSPRKNNKWDCLPLFWEKFKSPGEATHFLCYGCFGKNHDENSKAPIEIKHPLHPKHSLLLAYCRLGENRQCYCCDEDLQHIFYYCSACNFGIRISCARKSPVLSIEQPKWHEHTLHLFPSHAPLTCSLCALTHSSCLFYICPPCDFLVHQRCISLPHVIRISRHPHHIYFTYSFQKEDLFCGVCRTHIDKDYGGYHCIKDDCLYAAHSKCATQNNVWDGVELEGESEEEVEEVEPFMTISDGIIKHCSHEHHHLRLDDNKGKDYDDSKLCQACITPIYFGNFYSCFQCDFILHQECAQLSRTIHHPIHPHPLTLVTKRRPSHKRTKLYDFSDCSACPSLCVDGFFYKCVERKCSFNLHVQCATVSEPLLHASHMHPLFLTSKPEEERICSVCKRMPGAQERRSKHSGVPNKQTFNCIEEECDFALCFSCATLPQKVSYKHDKHMLPLSYGKTTSAIMYWCEACEGKINPTEGFYKCDKYCCVNLHIKCILGKDLYVMPGLFDDLVEFLLDVMPNNMSRPHCSFCKNRCPQKVVFHLRNLVFCSLFCVRCFQLQEE